MKTKITGLILATGFFAAAAFTGNAQTSSPAAPNSPKPVLPSPDAARPPGAAKRGRVAPARRLTAKQVILSEYGADWKRPVRSWQSQSAFHQLQPDADLFLSRSAPSAVIFSMTPSPYLYSDPNHPTTWFASISFPFDLSRRFRS